MVLGDVHGGGDGGHDGRRRWPQQGADELPAAAVGAADGRGQLHVHGQERGGLQEPAPPGDRHAGHERARGAGPVRDRVRPVRVVHVHHVHRRRQREYTHSARYDIILYIILHIMRTVVAACAGLAFWVH